MQFKTNTYEEQTDTNITWLSNLNERQYLYKEFQNIDCFSTLE